MTEITARLSTALADRYKLERHLGEGGMATVYLAEDLKHKRKVAVKVLRPELAAVLGAERFVQEITTTANLQHPHILPLFDSGEADGFLYYVMPYIEGETLRNKLNRETQLGIEEAVRITTEVADALDSAHRHNVIHRDIKPENILLHDGRPMVADFGIALAVSTAGGHRLTETGLSLGTPHYMSPEQAMGDREVDARSDVYALACVLYEMLAGEPPYTGPTAQAIVAKVLTEKAAPVSTYRDTVPPHVAGSIQQALNKLPADRFATAAQFAEALVRPDSVSIAAPTGATPATSIGAPAARDWRLPMAVASSVVLVGVVLWLAFRGAEPLPAAPAVRFTLTLPSEIGFGGVNTGRQIAISPDGTLIVYAGATESGLQLHMRRVGDTAIQVVPGTEGAGQPFFSPDGEWLGFVVGRTIRKVQTAGGPVLDVAVTPLGVIGPYWGESGAIIYSSIGTLFTVSSAGGTPARITQNDSAPSLLYWPELLPGGRSAVVTVGQLVINSQVGLLDLQTGELTILVPNGGQARYVSTGHLVYGHASSVLFAIPFDVQTGTVTGEATPVLPSVNVVRTGIQGATQFDVSRNGTAIYMDAATSTSPTELVLVDLDGRAEPLAIETGAQPRFSPDGTRIAYRAGSDIHVHHLTLGTTSRLTFTGQNHYPTWSPDGLHIAFTSLRPGSDNYDVYRRRADGRGDAEHVLSHPFAQGPRVWTDGGRLITVDVHPETQYDLHVLSLDSQPVMRTPYLTNEWNEGAPSLSPDGRWVAYASDESGQLEVYVSAFPEAGGRWKISEGGGADPLWAPDGETIYYLNDADLFAATVQTDPAVSVVGLSRVLTGPFAPDARFTNFDRHPESGRFVMVRRPTGTGVSELTVVVNWFEELKERVGN